MAGETQRYEKKSIRKVTGPSADFASLAETCVALAAAFGGAIHIGVEDGSAEPPVGQVIPADLPDHIRRRIGDLTVNVACELLVETAPSGGQYIVLAIPRSSSVPSTSNGRYFIREGDRNRPIRGDEVMRLARDRDMVSWETLTSAQIPRERADPAQVSRIVEAIRASDRVKQSVRDKSPAELLDHYALASGPWLTNLGILCVGTKVDRGSIGSAPVIQYLKYDDLGAKLNKIVWDDYTLSPIQLVDAVWNEVPDFRESYELPDGLFRKLVPAYEKDVVRELLVNALVHRSYVQHGDIFINAHPDRLVIVSPGPLPIGVTPDTVLHATVRRNEHMARLFHDLKLMDREGSGFDKMYEVLLAQGRDVPHLKEGLDRVEVSVGRRILKPQTIAMMTKVDEAYQLGQRETICLGLLAQHEHMTARELADSLMLGNIDDLKPWLGRLQELHLVESSGRTKATQYFVSPRLVTDLQLPTATTLGRIESHRLEALVLEDIRRYPGSSIGEIHGRVGAEISRSKLKRAIDACTAAGKLTFVGDRRWRRYTLSG